VRPVETDFARILWGDTVTAHYHEYLFVQFESRLTDTQFSRDLGRLSQEYFGCMLGLRNYRQIIVEVARVYLGSEYEVHQDDIQDEEDALAEQAGHTIATRQAHYAPELGLLPALSSDLLLRYSRISEWWWRLTGFFPGAVPLLPLVQCCGIRNDIGQPAQVPRMGEGDTGGSPPADLARLVEQLTAVITNSATQLKIELEGQIQTAVAMGIAEFMQRHPMQRSTVATIVDCGSAGSAGEPTVHPAQPAPVSSGHLPPTPPLRW
jgi:hypothetical protein